MNMFGVVSSWLRNALGVDGKFCLIVTIGDIVLVSIVGCIEVYAVDLPVTILECSVGNNVFINGPIVVELLAVLYIIASFAASLCKSLTSKALDLVEQEQIINS